MPRLLEASPLSITCFLSINFQTALYVSLQAGLMANYHIHYPDFARDVFNLRLLSLEYRPNGY